MKRITLILVPLFLLINETISFGQSLSDKDQMNQIEKIYDDSDSILKAKKVLENFIINNPKSIYTLKATYLLAEIAYSQKNIETATLLYKEVLACSIPKSENWNYRNYSAKKLASLYIDKKDFKTALKFIDLACKKFPLESFCGNAYAQDHIWMADLYSSCYNGQGKNKKAIEVLAPLMFNNRLANNSELVKKLYDTYLKIYS